MIVEENGKINRKPLPPLINLKYGEKSKKIYRLAKIKSEDFNYTNLLSLIKAYKPIKNNVNIVILLQKQGQKEGFLIKNEKEFTSFIESETLFTFIDKSSLKVDFFYTAASPENLKEKENSEQLEKAFHELSVDGNSKKVLDFVLEYVSKQRDFADKLFENLVEKKVINLDENEVKKDDFSKEILPGLLRNIKENYETLITTRDTNLNLNLSFSKAIYTEENSEEKFKPFNEMYNPDEIEDFSSRIVRDTLSSIQIIR